MQLCSWQRRLALYLDEYSLVVRFGEVKKTMMPNVLLSLSHQVPIFEWWGCILGFSKKMRKQFLLENNFNANNRYQIDGFE